MIYDVIVVGGGIAGLMAAIEAKTDTNKVALITKGNIFKSNSAMASGGINAVLDPEDKEAIESHIKDTYNSSKGLADIKSITYMCKKASTIISKLVSYGVTFQRDEKGNNSYWFNWLYVKNNLGLCKYHIDEFNYLKDSIEILKKEKEASKISAEISKIIKL